MSVFGPAVMRALLLQLRCPRCGEVQARAREPKGYKYRCRKCRASFTVDEGQKSKPSQKRKKPR